MNSKNLIAACVLVAAAVLIDGCMDKAPLTPVGGLGSVTISKYVAIGNSISAGFQSNALYRSAQVYSFPNLLAQQLTAAGANLGTFEQPWYSDPGTPDATGRASRMEIVNLAGPVILPNGGTPGNPTNLTLPRPYDNLGIPGIPLAGFMDTTGTYQYPPLGRDVILRWTSNPLLPKSVYKQVVMLRPDLVTFWLGANDVLGFALSGGISPSAPTPSATFTALYTQALDALRSGLPNARIVVANIPDVKALPFFNTIGPKVRPLIPAQYYLRYQKHGNRGVAFDSTKLAEANAPLLTLTGNTYAPLLGSITGKWYRDIGLVPPPAGIDTTKPFGFHPQNPWPDALTLDSDEQATAVAAVQAFNTTIATVAGARSIAVVDMFNFYNGIKANGLSASGQRFTADYISGGVFSLDGVHPSSRGHGLVANEFLRVINATYGTGVPYVDISTLPGIPAPISKVGSGGGDFPVIPYEVFRDLECLWRADQ